MAVGSIRSVICGGKVLVTAISKTIQFMGLWLVDTISQREVDRLKSDCSAYVLLTTILRAKQALQNASGIPKAPRPAMGRVTRPPKKSP